MFKKRQKIGETRPMNDISLDDSINVLSMVCNCGKDIIKMPLSHIECLPRFYDEFRYVCLYCKWESPKFITRTL